MATGRAKRIIALLNKNTNEIRNSSDEQNDVFYEETCQNKEQEPQGGISVEPCSSPLPPGAEAELWEHGIMRDVWNDVFSNDFHELPNKQTKSVAESTSNIPVLTAAVTPTAEGKSQHQPNAGDCQTDEDNDHRDAVREDPYMATDKMTPISLIDCPQSVNSLLPDHVDSPATPFTPIFNLTVPPSLETETIMENDQSDTPSTASLYTKKSTTVTQNDVCRFDDNKTPVPSPVNIHTKCADPFCCQHDTDKYDCPSVSTIGPDSNQPSPASTLIRNRGKKRPRNYKDWGDVKRKKLTNEGKTYCSKRGHTVEAKTMGPPCRCKFKCSTKFSNEERSQIFDKFWKLGDREKQWLHIANYTTKTNKSRTFQRELKHNRQFTYKYFLPKHSTDDDTYVKTDVCKTMFLNTLGISERMTRTAWKKYDGSTSVEKDMRGCHTSHKKVINDEMILSVCDHVNAFVPVESHYCRKFSKRLYLDGSLSIARMYEMYKDWPDLEKYTHKVTNLRQYRDIVNTHFNLSFHIPKKDTCDQCHIFKHTENPSEDLKADFEKHQRNKTLARELKNTDKTQASDSNGTIVCATFDFQKVLTCPHGQISILYYKRKLSCYNFTIYDMTTKKGYCYVWDDSVAKRGANEVSSCLYNFIKEFSGKGVQEFRFWSDNCAGQNRNRIVYAMYAHAAKEFGVTITHRFLEKGHTQNEGDSVHSVIERAAEHKLIYTPEEWKLLIRWAKIENPYEVIDVTKNLVYDFKELLKNKNWTKNTQNEKMTWNKIKQVMVEEDQPNKIRYKYKLDDEYKTLVVRKETRNRVTIALKTAYFEPVPISNDKFKDLLDLCKSGIIPNKHHDYFNALPHGRAVATNENETDEDSE